MKSVKPRARKIANSPLIRSCLPKFLSLDFSSANSFDFSISFRSHLSFPIGKISLRTKAGYGYRSDRVLTGAC